MGLRPLVKPTVIWICGPLQIFYICLESFCENRAHYLLTRVNVSLAQGGHAPSTVAQLPWQLYSSLMCYIYNATVINLICRQVLSVGRMHTERGCTRTLEIVNSLYYYTSYSVNSYGYQKCRIRSGY